MNVLKLKPRSLAVLVVITAGIIGGAIPVFTKLAVQDIPPFTFTFLRFLIASIFILPLVIRQRFKFDKNIYKIILLSFLATANVALFPFGVRLTTADISQMLYVMVPIIIAVLSYFWLREKITSKKIVGVILGFLASAIIILLPILGIPSRFNGNLTGNFIVFTAVVCFSIYTVLSKKAQKKYNPIFLTAIFFFTTTCILSIFAVSDYISNPNWVSNVSPASIFYVAYIGVLGGAVYYLLYQYAIKHASPLIASTMLYIQPIANFIWAFFILGEILTPLFIVAAILAFVAVWLINKR